MSNVVDDRVLEMRFDNKQFESGVAESMSTLDKLKQKLNLSGAAKGLADLDKAAKNVDMSGLGAGVEAVSAKFSALQVMGITALSNITNQAVNAGKKFAAAFTIDPIKSGFQEYETQINSVQTILANTSSKGTTLDEVNYALDELNHYADKTIYNFTEMTRNIGTFTAAGVDLWTSVSAIQGIANLAAISGSTSQQASTAMYQLSQALASGTVKLMDWNSVVNAGMGGEVFKNALIEMSELMGTGAQEMIEYTGSFRDSLSTGWLTADVLTETLKRFTTSGVNEFIADYTGMSLEAVEATVENAKAQYDEADAMKAAAKEIAEKTGADEEQIRSALEMAQTAEDAATKVKTWTQLWDTLKEAAQSGWTQTWELIIGDFEEAKALWTGISDFLGGIIGSISDARNNLLEAALGSPFGQLAEKLGFVTSATEEMTASAEEYADIVQRVISGEFGNGETRFQALTEAGYDWAHVQNLVNEQLGSSYRYETEYAEGLEGATDATVKNIDELVKLNDEKLKEIGFTEDEIAMLRSFQDEAEATGKSVQEIWDSYSQAPTGRELLFEGLKNIGLNIVGVFQAIGDAYRSIFPPMEADRLYGMLEAFYAFTDQFVMTEEVMDKLTRTFRGFFAILDIVKTVLTSGISLAFKAVTGFLKAFGLNILDVTAFIGDMLVVVDNVIQSFFDVGFIFQMIGEGVKILIDVIKEWASGLGIFDGFQKVLEKIGKKFNSTVDKIQKGSVSASEGILKLASSVKDILWKWLRKSFPVLESFVEKIESLVDAFKNIPAIKKLSLEFKTLRAIFDTAMSGFRSGSRSALDAIGYFCSAAGRSISKFLLTNIPGLQKFVDVVGSISKMAIEKAQGLIGAFAGLPIVKDLAYLFDSLKGSFGTAMNGIKNGSMGAADAISYFCKSSLQILGNFLLNTIPGLNKFVTWIQNVAKSFKNLDSVKSVIERLKEFGDSVKKIFEDFDKENPAESFLKLWDEIKALFGDKDLKNSTQQIGIDIVEGIKIGIGNGIDDIIAKAQELANNIISTVCDILGIHSPSTVMIGIGAMIVAGLIIGIKQGLVDIPVPFQDMLNQMVDKLGGDGFSFKTAKKNLLTKMSNFLNSIDYGEVFAATASGAILFSTAKISDAINTFVHAFDGVDNVLDSVAGAIKNFSVGVKENLRANAIKKLAVSLLILAAAVAVLAFIPRDKLEQAMISIVILAGVLGGLSIAISKLSKTSGEIDRHGINFEGLQTTLLQIGLAVILLAASVKMIGGMNLTQAVGGFLGLAAIMAALIIFLKQMNKAITPGTEAEITAMATLMKKLGIALILMTFAVKLIGKLSVEEMLKGAAFMAGFVIFVKYITKACSTGRGPLDKFGGMLISMAFSMMLLVGVIKLVDMLSVNEMFKGAAFMAGFIIFVKYLVKATTIGKKQQIAQISGLLLSISFAMMLMVGVFKLVDMLSIGEVLKGAAFVAGFIIFVKKLVEVTKIGRRDKIAQVSGMILAMSVAIGILAGVCILLGFVKIPALAKGIVAIGLLSYIMKGLIEATKGAKNVYKTVVAMAVAIAVMAAAIYALSTIKDVKNLAAATIALGVIMGMFALIEYSSQYVTGSIKTLAVMVVAVGLLAVVLYLLSTNISNPDGAVKIAISLGILMGALAACMYAIGKAGPVSLKAIGSMACLTLVLGEIGIILGLMQYFNVSPSLETVSALSILLLTLAGTMAILGAIKPVGIKAIAGMAGLAVVLGMIGVVLGIMQYFNVAPSLETVASLSVLLLAMAGVTAILAYIGPTAGFALDALVVFAIVVAGIGALLVALGALVTEIPKVGEFLDAGIPILEKIGVGLGKFIGGFIGGIGEGLMDSLLRIVVSFQLAIAGLVAAGNTAKMIKVDNFDNVTKLLDVLGKIAKTTVGTSISDVFTLGGTSMEKFSKDGQAFFTAMGEISTAAEGIKFGKNFDGVVDAAGKLATLQSSLSSIGGVVSWFKGRDDLGTFGKNAKKFFESMQEAFGISNTTFINPSCIANIIKAATDLATLQSSLEPIGGVITWFKGRDDLGAFGKNVKNFFENMQEAFSFSNTTFVNPSCVTNIITACTQLVDLQSSLSSIGGVITWFKGRDDLGAFGKNVKNFFENMQEAFSFSNTTFVNPSCVTNIITACTQLVDLQSSLSSIGGVITWFKGRDDLGAFGKNAANFFTSMQEAFKVANTTFVNPSAVGNIVTACTKIADLQSSLEPIGGVISWFKGKKDLGDFGTNVGIFATAIGDLKTAMGENGITEAVIASITNTGTALVELQKALPKEGWFDGKMNLTDFSTYMTDFGTAMGTLVTSVSKINQEKIDIAMSTATRIRNFINSLADFDATIATDFTGKGMTDGCIINLAQAIGTFSDISNGIDEAKITTAINSAVRLRNFINSLEGFDSDLSDNFDIEDVGDKIKGYADAVEDLNVQKVTTSMTTAYKLKTFISGLKGFDSSTASNFKPGPIGTSLKTYSANVSGIDTGSIDSSIKAATKLRNFITSLNGFSSSGVGAFKTAVSSLAETNIKDITKSFGDASSRLSSSGTDMMKSLAGGIKSNSSSVTQSAISVVNKVLSDIKAKAGEFNKAGSTLMSNFVKGINAQSGAARSAGSAVASSAVGGTSGYYSSFHSMGSYVASGFVSGIRDKIWSAANAAAEMAAAAERAARERLNINSPSKVFRAIGSGIPEGFVQGIGMMGSAVKQAVYGMGDTAITSMNKSMSRLGDMLSSDIDYQPTIRPVVDLSDVQAGASAISGLFSNQTVGLNANVRAASVAMGSIQNGTVNDVISSLDKLRKDLGNVGNTTYSINGITYDDGSNIANAVRAITREARIQRRM